MWRIYCSLSEEAYDSDMHLSLADIALDDKNNPTVIQVTIKWSKTDPFRKGVELYLGKTGKDICPVCAIIPYLVIRGVKPGPLFVFADGLYLTRQWFASLVTSTLQRAGIDNGTTQSVSGQGQPLQQRKLAYQMCIIKCLGDGRVAHINYMSAPHGTSLQDSQNKW